MEIVLTPEVVSEIYHPPKRYFQKYDMQLSPPDDLDAGLTGARGWNLYILLFSYDGCRDGMQSGQLIIKHCDRDGKGIIAGQGKLSYVFIRNAIYPVMCGVVQFNVGRNEFCSKAVLKTTTCYSYNTVALTFNNTLANMACSERILQVSFGMHDKAHLET